MRGARALGQPASLAFAYSVRGFVLIYGAADHEAALSSLTEPI